MNPLTLESKEIDRLWLWKTFNLVTPWAAGRYITIDDIQPEDHENIFSLPAITINRLLNIQYDNFINLDSFSDETLKKIVAAQHKDSDNKSPDRKWLEEQIHSFIINELDSYAIHPAMYPIRNLLNGFLYNKNWELLSENDLKLWIIGYGTNSLNKVISIQNSLFRELLESGRNYEVRGINIVKELIQPEYDPDYVAPLQILPNDVGLSIKT